MTCFQVNLDNYLDKHLTKETVPHSHHHEEARTMLQQLQQVQCKHLHHCKMVEKIMMQLNLPVSIPGACCVTYLEARCLAADVEQFISCSA